MKIRLTPLNILTSLLAVSAVYFIIFSDKESWEHIRSIPLLVMALISFIADVIFRWRLTNLKRIWIVELGFIIFAAVLIILLQKI